MRKASFAIIIGFAFLVGLVLLLGQSLFVLQRVARISDVSGTISVIRKGEENVQPLGERRLVQAGEQLSTGAEGQCTLNWIDGTRIRMEPSTELTVQKCQVYKGSKERAFRLDIGKIWIRVLRVLSQQDKFLINTPTATAGVRGTMFSVEVAANGSTEISVYEGQVTVAGDSDEVKVAANETARLGGSQAGPQVIALSTQQQEIWQRQMQYLGPYLEITETTLSDDTLTVKGRTERGAKVMVGGRSVTPKANGRFTVHLDMMPEKLLAFTLEAVATDSKGYKTEVQRRVVRRGLEEEIYQELEPEATE